MSDEARFLAMLLKNSQKYPRKEFSFGEENKKADLNTDVVFIRENNVLSAWVGAATWDASILMSHYMIDNHDFLKDKKILECGSGSGLLGLVLGRYCREICLTDYQNSILDNIEYNIWLNTHELTAERMEELFPCSESSQFYEFAKKCRNNYINNNKAIIQSTKVAYLDWFHPENTEKPEYELEPDSNPKLPPNNIRYRIKGGLSMGKFSMIFGSELTYCLQGVPELVSVIETFLEEGGVFWEIISIFRGKGPKLFMKTMEEHGFIVEARNVRKEYYEKMNKTLAKNKNKYSHTEQEQYLLWTCYRKADLMNGAMERMWGSIDKIPKFGAVPDEELVNWKELNCIENDHLE